MIHVAAAASAVLSGQSPAVPIMHSRSYRANMFDDVIHMKTLAITPLEGALATPESRPV
jgi:hypothetical protein